MKALFLLSSGGCGKQASISPSLACPHFISLFILWCVVWGEERGAGGGADFNVSDSARSQKTGFKGARHWQRMCTGCPVTPASNSTLPHLLNWPTISATLLKGELLITVLVCVLARHSCRGPLKDLSVNHWLREGLSATALIIVWKEKAKAKLCL